MADREYNSPLFGFNIDPSPKNLPLAYKLAQLADEAKIDLISIQDHPYNATFFDTWTLLTFLAARTQHVRLLTNVANLPLRPPAMLAKAAATLDVLTGGRVELGLGAGGFWDGIASYGGPRRSPSEAVGALEEAIVVMRTLWQSAPVEQVVNFSGQYYQLVNAHPGPAPAHPIGIWLGALRPRMLRLTGRQADGLVISASYIPPEDVPAVQQIVNEGAQEADRDPLAIRRVYNLMGAIVQPGSRPMVARRKGIIVGTARHWVDEILRYYNELRMDTFIFWSVLGDEGDKQAQVFAREVIPAVVSAISQ